MEGASLPDDEVEDDGFADGEGVSLRDRVLSLLVSYNSGSFRNGIVRKRN